MRTAPQLRNGSGFRLDDARERAADYVRRLVLRLAGLALALAGLFVLLALATWNVTDPSLSHATGNPVTN